MPLLLRRLKLEDKAMFEVALGRGDDPNHPLALGRQPDQSFEDYVKQLANHENGFNLQKGHVNASYFCAVVDGQIVGRVSLRHDLNDVLLQVGGHIGYIVLSQFRRLGYATEMLRQTLPKARDLALKRVLLTCDPENTHSIKVIESCGGALESVYEGSLSPGKRKLRYWINL